MILSRPRQILATMIAASLVSIPTARAVTGSWAVDANGSWGLGVNWNGGIIPGAVDDVAEFVNDISAARTVTIDGTRTIGTLRVGDANGTAAFTLTAVPTGGGFIFDVAAGQALLEFTNGGAIANTLTVPMVLNDDLRIAITGSSTAAHILNGPISDGGGSARAVVIDANGTHPPGTPSGVGQVTLNGINTFSGGLTADQVRVTAGTAFALGTGTARVNDGGQVFASVAATFNNNFVLHGLGWNEVTHGQLGALRTDQNNTFNGTVLLNTPTVRIASNGNTSVFNGVISEAVAGTNLDVGRWVPAGGAAMAGTIVINSTTAATGVLTISSGTLRIGNGGTTGDITSFGSVVFGLTNNNAEAASTATLAFQRSDNITFTKTVTEAVNGAGNRVVGSLAHAGTGVLTWDNAASGYTGATTVSGLNGKLVFGSSGAYPFAGTGNVTLSNGADLEFNSSGSIEIGGGAKPAAQVFGSAAGSYLIQSGTGTITLGGTSDNAGGRVQINSGTVVLAKTSTAAIHALGGGGDLSVILNNGTLQLAGSGGDQIVDGGAVRITSGTFDLNGQSEAFDVLTGAGGTLTNNNAATSTLTVGSLNSVAVISQGVPFAASFGGVIANGAGAINFTKAGTGVQTFTGANTYSGATTINGGVLAINGSLLATGAVVVNSAATLAGTGAVGNVTLTAGSNLRPGASQRDTDAGTLTANSLTVLGGDLRFNRGATNDLLAVTGTANFISAATITPAFTAPPAVGTVDLLTSTGLTLTTAPTLAGIPVNTRSTFALGNTATALQLIIGGNPAQALTYSGTVSGAWDVGLTPNFTGGTEAFFNLDAVTFGDGPTNRTITLANPLTPSAVTVNNSTGNDYIFQTGVITGPTGLTKTGGGLLTMNVANTFEGAVTITGGTIRAGNAAALGTINGQTFVSGGGTLDVGGQNLGAERVSIAGTGVGGNGAIINNGAGQNNAFRFLTLTGDTTIGGANRYDIRANGGGEIFDLGGFTLTKIGANQFSVVGIPAVTNGSFIVNQGMLSFETTSVVQGTGTITLNPGATLAFFQTVAANFTRPIIVNGGTVDGFGQNSAVGSNFTLNGDVTFTESANTFTLAGSVTEAGGPRALTKTGGGTVTFTGAVAYTGTTTVSAGTLNLGIATAPVPQTAGIAISGGATLILSGTGNLATPVSIATSGGTMRWAGGTQGSTLTLNGVVGTLQTTGALSVQQGTVTLASGANVTVGGLDVGRTSHNTNNIGTLNIQAGATVTIGNTFYIGESAAGLTGIVNQTGGDVVVNGTDSGVDGAMRIGHWSGQGSQYNISGGTLSVLNGHTSVGIDGVQPMFNISGGAVTLKRLYVDGRGITAPMAYLRLSGGVLSLGDGGMSTNPSAGAGTPSPNVQISGGTLRAFTTAPGITPVWSVGMSFDNTAGTIDTNGVNVLMSGAANGPGGFTKIGAGTLTLSNANNNLRGAVSIDGGIIALSGAITGQVTTAVNSGGALVVTGSIPASTTTTVGSGGVLAGAGDGVTTGTIGNVTIATGATLRPGAGVVDSSVGTFTLAGLTVTGGNLSFDLNPLDFTTGLGVNDLLAVNGLAQFTGGTITPVWNATPAAGTYTLVTSTGMTLTPAPTINAAAASRQTYTLQPSGNNLQLVVAGAAKTLTWSGTLGGNAWDLNTTANWRDAAPNDEKFFAYDNVVFDNTGANTPDVNLIGSLLPGSTTVNSTLNYTFGGSGGIGSGTLTKLGIGALILASNNTYPGLTTIGGGVLQIGAGGTTGGIGAGAITNDAALIINRSDALTLANAINGIGSVLMTGGGTLTLPGANSYTGGTTISAGTVVLTHVSGASNGPVTLGDANTGASNTALLTTNNLNPTNTLVVSANGTGTVTIGTIAGGTTGSTFSGSLELNRAATLQGQDASFTGYSGQITGPVGTLTIAGGGRTILMNPANDFTGDIFLVGVNTVLQAALAGGSPESIPNSSSIVMVAGTTFQIGHTVAGAETIKSLNGTGTVQLNNAGAAGTTRTLILGSGDGAGSFAGTVQNGGGAVPFALTKIGAGTQSFTGAVNSTGSITITGGVMAFGNAFGAGLARAALATDATLDNILTVNTGLNTNDLVVGMSVTGTGVPAGSRITSIPTTTTVTIAGTQTATLAGNLTFGAAPMFLTNGGTFRYTGAARTDDRMLNLDVTGGVLDASGTGILTLSGSPLQFTGSGARTLTLSGTSALNNVLSTVLTNEGANATSLVKTGPGTWLLSAANTFTGGTTISAGTIKLGVNTSPFGPIASTVVVADGATVDANAQNVAAANRIASLTVQGAGVGGLGAIQNSAGGIVNSNFWNAITLTGDTTIGTNTRYDFANGTFNGGTFTLTKVGTGETWWSPAAGATVGTIVVNAGIFGVQGSGNLGDNTLPIIINAAGSVYTFNPQTNAKPIILNGGFLAANSSTGTWTGPITLNGAGTTNRFGIFNVGVGVTLAGKISGTGFEKITNGLLEIQNPANDWNGDTRITAGIVRVSAGGILSPNTTLDMNGGTLDLNFSNQTVAGLMGTAGIIQGDALLTVAQLADTTYGGTINGFTSLTKAGGGRLALSGTSPTTGNTTVEGGTLLVNGSLSGSFALVQSGGTLGGTGAVGVVAVNGGALAPGAAGPGTFATGELTLNAATTLRFELAQPGVIGSGTNDLLTTTGNLTLDGTLAVTELPGFGDGTYRLANFTGILTNLTLDLEAGFLAAHPGSFVDVSTAQQVNLVVIPEPSAAALLAAAALLGLRRRRR